MGHGVSFTHCRAAADFGKGFYVTSSPHQAQQWANQKAKSSPGPTVNAAVLEWEMDWDWTPLTLDVMAFALDHTPFHNFVLLNRCGSTTHGRLSSKQYDIVIGPVAAYPQTLTFANCDQICFVAGGPNVTVAISHLLSPPGGRGKPTINVAAPYFP